MFNRNSQPMAHNEHETIIAQGVKVEGDFDSKGSVSIDGEVTGSVRTAQALRVGEAARIHADVSAQTAVIAGEVRGNLRVADRLELLETANIQGDIEAQVFSVAPGARVNGRVNMGGTATVDTGEAE